MAGTSTTQPHMNTSQKISHVYACLGAVYHVTPGFQLLRSGDIKHCPTCGAQVFDATDTPVGQAYIAFARIDLGEKPS